MRILMMSAVALASYLIQSTFLEFIKIYNIKPNLLIITVISYALIRGKEEGALYGLFSGMLLDFMSGKHFGIYTLLGLYLGLIVGVLNDNLYNENYLTAMFLVGCGTLAYNFAYYVITFFPNVENSLYELFITVMLPEALYNIALSLIVYFAILYMNKKMDYRRTSKISFNTYNGNNGN